MFSAFIFVCNIYHAKTVPLQVGIRVPKRYFKRGGSIIGIPCSARLNSIGYNVVVPKTMITKTWRNQMSLGIQEYHSACKNNELCHSNIIWTSMTLHIFFYGTHSSMVNPQATEKCSLVNIIKRWIFSVIHNFFISLSFILPVVPLKENVYNHLLCNVLLWYPSLNCFCMTVVTLISTKIHITLRFTILNWNMFKKMVSIQWKAHHII